MFILTDTMLLPFKSITHVTMSKCYNGTTQKERDIFQFWYVQNGKSDYLSLDEMEGLTTLTEYKEYLEGGK